MKIIYIADTRLPSEMAQGLQVMKMCEAFASCRSRLTRIATQKNADIDVELVVPWRFRISDIGKKDPFEYYKVDKIFKIRKIFCFDLTPLNRFLGPVSFLIQALSFSFFAFIYLLFKEADVIYGRDRFSLFWISFFRKNIVFEVHKIHKFLFWRILERARKIVIITRGIKEILITRGIKEDKILIAPDGVDLEDFEIKESKENCRRELNLPLDKKLVVYTGHLYKWKGVETLVLASKFLPDDTLIVIVGGIKWYLSNFKNFVKKNNLKNILILGYQNYSKIPYFLKAADCLVLTGTKKSEVSQYQTSPMKMFEYMTSGKPIVASDLTSFKDVLNQVNSVLVESDDPKALAEGIKKILDNPDLTNKISNQAYEDVKKYTWHNRAKRILEFIA